MPNLLIYGATGYTGKLCARKMLQHDLEPVLAARSSKVQAVAQELGCSHAIFDLENTQRITENLQNIDLVINLAGPFSRTQTSLIRACIAAQTHYLDIAGEVEDLQAAYAFDAEAKQAGIMLMPGAGFGVVPTDIAAGLAKTALPDATHLTIAYATEGGASRGTLNTVLKNIHTPGFRRVNHVLQTAHPAETTLNFTVAGKNFSAVYNPWRADLFSAGLSTNIPNIETYSVFPGVVVRMMQGKLLWLRDLLRNHLLRFLPEGPSRKQLQTGATYVIAITQNAQGAQQTISLTGPEAYLFTAHCLIALSKQISQGNHAPGFQTPAYYGKELLAGIENVVVYE